MTVWCTHIRYCAGALSLINHVTFWGGLNDLAGVDQLEMAGAGELNCFWKWPRQPIYMTASMWGPLLAHLCPVPWSLGLDPVYALWPIECSISQSWP